MVTFDLSSPLLAGSNDNRRNSKLSLNVSLASLPSVQPISIVDLNSSSSSSNPSSLSSSPTSNESFVSRRAARSFLGSGSGTGVGDGNRMEIVGSSDSNPSTSLSNFFTNPTLLSHSGDLSSLFGFSPPSCSPPFLSSLPAASSPPQGVSPPAFNLPFDSNLAELQFQLLSNLGLLSVPPGGNISGMASPSDGSYLSTSHSPLGLTTESPMANPGGGVLERSSDQFIQTSSGSGTFDQIEGAQNMFISTSTVNPAFHNTTTSYSYINMRERQQEYSDPLHNISLATSSPRPEISFPGNTSPIFAYQPSSSSDPGIFAQGGRPSMFVPEGPSAISSPEIPIAKALVPRAHLLDADNEGNNGNKRRGAGREGGIQVGADRKSVRQAYASQIPSQHSFLRQNGKGLPSTAVTLSAPAMSRSSRSAPGRMSALSPMSRESRLSQGEEKKELSWKLARASFDLMPLPASHHIFPDFMDKFYAIGRNIEEMDEFAEIVLACHMAIGAKVSADPELIDASTPQKVTKLKGDLTYYGLKRHAFCQPLYNRCFQLATSKCVESLSLASPESIACLLMLETVSTLYYHLTENSRKLVKMACEHLVRLFRDEKTAKEKKRLLRECGGIGGLCHWVYSRDSITATAANELPLLQDEDLYLIFNEGGIDVTHYTNGYDVILKYDPTQPFEHLEIVQVCSRSCGRYLLNGFLKDSSISAENIIPFVRTFWKKQNLVKEWTATYALRAPADKREPLIGPKKHTVDRMRLEMVNQTKLFFVCHNLIHMKMKEFTNPDDLLRLRELYQESTRLVAELISELASYASDVCNAGYDISSPRLAALRSACCTVKYLPGDMGYLKDYLNNESCGRRYEDRKDDVTKLMKGWRCMGWSWTDDLKEVEELERAIGVVPMPHQLPLVTTSQPVPPPPSHSLSSEPVASFVQAYPPQAYHSLHPPRPQPLSQPRMTTSGYPLLFPPPVQSNTNLQRPLTAPSSGSGSSSTLTSPWASQVQLEPSDPLVAAIADWQKHAGATRHDTTLQHLKPLRTPQQNDSNYMAAGRFELSDPTSSSSTGTGYFLRASNNPPIGVSGVEAMSATRPGEYALAIPYPEIPLPYTTSPFNPTASLPQGYFPPPSLPPSIPTSTNLGPDQCFPTLTTLPSSSHNQAFQANTMNTSLNSTASNEISLANSFRSTVQERATSTHASGAFQYVSAEGGSGYQGYTDYHLPNNPLQQTPEPLYPSYPPIPRHFHPNG